MYSFSIIATTVVRIVLIAMGVYFSYKGIVNDYNSLYRYTFWTFLLMLLTFFIGPIANVLAIAVLVLGCYMTLKDSIK